MIHLRSYLAFLLVVVMVLTSQSMALARGSVMSAGQIVLCTGTGPVLVDVDKDGQPITPPHFCPDCALTVLAAVAAPEFLIVRQFVASKVQWNVHVVKPASAQRHPASARDPPLV